MFMYAKMYCLTPSQFVQKTLKNDDILTTCISLRMHCLAASQLVHGESFLRAYKISTVKRIRTKK